MKQFWFTVLLIVFFSDIALAVTTDERLRKIEIGQAKVETRLDDLEKSMNKQFDALNQRISDLYMVVVALMIGIFGFSAYLAYDRRKLNKIILEIQQGIYANKSENKEQDKSIEGLTEALKKLSKKDKPLADILHKFGLM